MTAVGKYGTDDVTINIPSGEFNPATGEYELELDEMDQPVETTYPVKVIASAYNDYLVSKDTIELSDVNLTVALFGHEPNTASIVNLKGIDYQVLKVRRIDVQGVVIGWQLQLRV